MNRRGFILGNIAGAVAGVLGLKAKTEPKCSSIASEKLIDLCGKLNESRPETLTIRFQGFYTGDAFGLGDDEIAIGEPPYQQLGTTGRFGKWSI